MNNSRPTVLITGAFGGIGQALIEVFHSRGYRVLATDKRKPMRDLPYDHFIQADTEKTVSNEVYAESIFAEIREVLHSSKLDALINNAAVQILAPTEALSRTDWHTTLDTNLLAPFFWTQTFLKELTKAHGSVVNISSIHAQQTKSSFVAYATSKAALSALTKNMAIDLGKNVRINAIEPAAVRTEMLVQGFKGNENKLAELEQFHPLGRIAQPEEIAKVAVYLCSDDASFLQGSVVSASGGIHGSLSDPG
jgi:NAD(P)-dependent dehydrogenase (short-subunit alcohol dehydrogenase family)